MTAVHAEHRTESAKRWWSMVGVEVRLLVRRRTTLLSVLSGPAMMIVFGFLQESPTPLGWAVLAGVAGLIGILVSTYCTATSVLTVRRESGALSRQRTTELTGMQIVTAAAAPLLTVGVAQAMVVFGVYVLLGAPFPRSPVLVLLGIVASGGLCVAAAALTSTFSSSAEGAQYTVMPLLLASAIGANLVANPAIPDAVRSVILLVPGTAATDLVARAWIGSTADLLTLPVPVPVAVADVALLAVWTLILAAGARARWRWTARG